MRQQGMLFFHFHRQTRSRANQINLDEIRQRVHGIRERSDKALELSDLFAMVGEDDRIGRPLLPPTAEPEPGRLLPHQVPNSDGHTPLWE